MKTTDPYRPLFIEVDTTKCDGKGHREDCKDRLGCFLEAYEEYLNRLRRYEDLPPL